MEKKKLLAFDCDPAFQLELQSALGDRYTLLPAGSEDEALRLAELEHPDVAILAIDLPGRGAIDLCRELKNAEGTRDLPIILVASGTRKDELVPGMQAGADAYPSKPLYPSEVLAQIDAHLRSRGHDSDLEHRDLQMLLELSDALSNRRNPLAILRLIVGKMAEVVDVACFSILSVGRNRELVVKALTRVSDLPARYGGEGFAILLPQTATGGVLDMTRRLGSGIRSLRFDGLDGARITISTGAATFTGENVQTFHQFVQAADRAMYLAKIQDKDRFLAMAYPPSPAGEKLSP